MPQTLTKPVLLDETGQAIAGKLDTNSAAIVEALDDIKDAIGNSEFIPLMLRVITPPTKTAYLVGETLDLTGMVVSLIASNGAQIDVTSACTFAPANGATLTSANTSIAISYYYPKDAHTFTASQAILVRELMSISVSTPPAKTTYKVGETLDLTGINVLAVYDDGSVESVTQDCVYSPANGVALSISDTSVSISYTLNGVTKTTSQLILVREVSSVVITTPPTKTTYSIGDALDMSGLVVTATYSDGYTENVANECTFNPPSGTVLTLNDTTVTVTYTASGNTYTMQQAITVKLNIWGVEWDGTASPTLSRTDDAENFTDPVIATSADEVGSSPFDSCMPWSGMVVNDDDPNAVLVSIPKFYYKWTKDSSSAKIKLQISDNAAALDQGFRVSPAHEDRGDGVGERSIVYVGRYIVTKQSSSTYPSKSGLLKNANTLNVLNTAIHNFSADSYAMDLRTYMTVYMLALVEFASWKIKQAIWGSNSPSQSYNQNTGVTDAMVYHTGICKKDESYNWYSSQYRHIENFFAGSFFNTIFNGIKFYDGSFYPYKNLANFDPSSASVTGSDAQIDGARSPYTAWNSDVSVLAVSNGGAGHNSYGDYILVPVTISNTTVNGYLDMTTRYNSGVTLLGFYTGNNLSYTPISVSEAGTTRLVKLPNS